MVLNLSVPELKELKPKITVFGVGGAGGNAINNMINAGLAGVEFVAANTDAQALSKSLSDSKMQLGVQITKGLGAGSHPDIGKSSADETKHEIMERLEGTNMLFITAGMGGGTGTGAAPVIARVAKELGILTVAVVTKPFQFEGAGRMRIAEQGLKELECLVDTTIVIPNQNLFRVADEKTTFADAFSLADDVLHAGVRSITDLMVVPGLINLDFADVKTIMNNMGRAMMGTGEASGENRAVECAHAAVTNPLLDDYSLDGAKGLLINITGGTDLTLHEVDKITNEIREQVHPDADVIVGSIFDEKLEGTARVSVVATGLDTHSKPGKSVVDLQVAKNSSIIGVSTPVETSNNHAINSQIETEVEDEVSSNNDAETKEEELINRDTEVLLESSEIDEEVSPLESEMQMEIDSNHTLETDTEVERLTELQVKIEDQITEEEPVLQEELAPQEEPFLYIDEPESSEKISMNDEDQAYQNSDEIEAEELIEEKSNIIDDQSEVINSTHDPVEENASPSILDLISRDKDNHEEESSEEKESSPDLFNDNKIHELNSEIDEELTESDDDHVETDQDLLEIPSFLRRQSK
tara:strand:+ start:173 stop:1924 length:1752 start_codon:yes stop_codon:yes gene_type:complete